MKQTPQSVVESSKKRRSQPTLGCILMASGLGMRFGGNKLLAPFGGQPLIRQILSATDTELFTRRVVVTRHREIVEICRQTGVEAILHDRPHRNDTIRIGLESLGENPPDGCMFCPCDQPLLSKKTLEHMAGTFIRQPDAIYQLSYKNTPGSPLIFPRSYFPALKTLPQGKGGSYLLHSSAAQVRYLEAASAWELKDADTPEDFLLLEKKRATS